MNRTWLITGGSDGIGAALAREVVRRGDRVALLARTAERLAAVAATLRIDFGAEALEVVGDVTKPDDNRRAVRAVIERFGQLDIFVANAGRTSHALFAETEPEAYRQAMELNFFGAIDGLRAALPALESSKGTVVLLSSITGLRGFPTRSAYCSTKFALEGFAESVRPELRSRGIAVVSVCPGIVATRFRERAISASGAPIGPDNGIPSFGGAMTAEHCARRIADAAIARRRRVVIGTTAKFTRLLSILAPGLLDRIMARMLEQGKI